MDHRIIELADRLGSHGRWPDRLGYIVLNDALRICGIP